MCIVNGRSGMPDDMGNFTCMTHNGESLIDLVLTKYSNFAYLRNFQVHEYTEFSNHTPVSFVLHIATSYVRETTRTKVQYRWNETFRNDFRTDISLTIPELNTVLGNDDVSVDKKVDYFSSIVTDNAEKYFKKCVKCSMPSFVDKDTERKKWFNTDCIDKQRKYQASLAKYLNNRNSSNLNELHTSTRDYKICVKRSKYIYNRERCRKMYDMRRLRPRDFWRMFKTRPTCFNDSVSSEDLFEHFKSLSKQNIEDNDDFSDYLKIFDGISTGNNSCTFEELDVPITYEEVNKACKNLKRSKSPGLDNIINEYFIEASDILTWPVTMLFNSILDSGKFPRSWSQGVIVPVLKKQPSDNSGNYRGVTLTSCFAKLFTTVINERLKTWSIQNDKITDAQIGFRSGHGTTDAIFVLQTLIDYYLNSGKRVYCAFVDYQKAFDSISRSAV
ncbi:uncharacterized protein LOC128553365 [Mercenaria mercenaria]|uniref:uncharacterized protein LOC128553365 n=1 Tax=Mercenaria mercenaria TaxID=6596 RepID=UPI00234F4CC3|nr:uncharacterized protein LOC128553365 [Mercenaria mercenaria]